MIDSTSPELLLLSPQSGSGDISITQNLELVFNEPVGWNSGNIIIHRVKDDSIFETIPVGGGPVTGSGTETLSINPFNNFEELTEYYVLVEGGAIRDLAGNDYEGFTAKDIWIFTTQLQPSISKTTKSRIVSGAQRFFSPRYQLPTSRVEDLLRQIEQLQSLVIQLGYSIDENSSNSQDFTDSLNLNCVPFLRIGSRGESVSYVQQKLNIPVDGIFGPRTQSAVRDFQQERGLHVDGIAGPQTCQLL